MLHSIQRKGCKGVKMQATPFRLWNKKGGVLHRLSCGWIGVVLMGWFAGCGDLTATPVVSSCELVFSQGDGGSADGTLSTAATTYAQSFTSEAPFTLRVVILNLKSSTGSQTNDDTTPLTGTVQLKLELDESGEPSNLPIATSTLSADAILSTSYVDYGFALSQPVEVEKNTRYWIRIQFPSAENTRRLLWQGSSSNLYTNGSAMSTANGVDWSQDSLGESRDFLFKVGSSCTN